MEEELLDEGLSTTEISENLKSTGASMAPWIKIVAITNIAIQALTLLISISYGAFNSGSFIGVGISIALYLTLLKYGQSMGTFGKEGSMINFSDVMDKQKAYFVFVGILMIIAIVVLLIAFVALGDDFFRVIERLSY
jgi:hypothetical protein